MHIIIGDFNIDMLKQSEHRFVLENIMKSYNLYITNNLPTTTYMSLIDHIWSNTPKIVKEKKNIPIYWSDYDAINITLNIKLIES